MEVKMKKRFFAILSIFAATVILVALVPGCDGTEPPVEEATILVEATLCGDDYDGAMAYTLSATGENPQNGTSVPASHTVAPGEWTLEVTFGPAGAYILSIDPAASQTVAANGTITFTVNFEQGQDAWVEFKSWTVNGQEVPHYYQTGEPTIILAGWEGMFLGDVIDVHFIQGVSGCPGVPVSLNETAELMIYYLYPGEGEPLPPLECVLHVANDDCAVNKTALGEAPEPDKAGQTATVYAEPVPACTELWPGVDIPPIWSNNDSADPMTEWVMSLFLDEHSTWSLVKEVDYEKSVNWLTFGAWSEPPQEWPMENVMFQIAVPPEVPWPMVFALVPILSVELNDDEDINPANNEYIGLTTPLIIAVVPPI
jgi:hypothetical protein